MNRIRKSGTWLGEIAGVLLRRRAPAPRSGGDILAGRQLRILDGSIITAPAAGFVMVLTSLPDSIAAAEVLDAYRLRWQVDLAFKQLKSLLGLDRLPAKAPTWREVGCWLTSFSRC